MRKSKQQLDYRGEVYISLPRCRDKVAYEIIKW
jgi:hypothetical protein